MQGFKKGFLSVFIKIVMIIVFMALGIGLIVIAALYINDSEVPKWLTICNIVFGCLLLTAPLLLKQEVHGILAIVRRITIIIFTIIGILLIIGSSILLANHVDVAKWFPIVNLVFGCMLLTSPAFLKK